MELRKFEITKPEFKWSTLGEFNLPHIKVRLVFTPNWQQQFTLFVTQWDNPTSEQSYGFETYQEAFDMFVVINNTNRVALDEVPEILEAPVDTDDEFEFTSKQKKEAKEFLEI